jgi:serine phosphatase RsbU (regulator of sigma subunit)
VAEDGYATKLLGRVDLPTGVLTVVNAGRVAPYLARVGRVTPIELASSLPLGLFHDETYVANDLRLQPGNRVVS